jgi:hypothetical protein
VCDNLTKSIGAVNINTALSDKAVFILTAPIDLVRAEFYSTILKEKDSRIPCNVVPLYQTTWCHIPEDCELDMDWHPNFEDHITQILF